MNESGKRNSPIERHMLWRSELHEDMVCHITGATCLSHGVWLSHVPSLLIVEFSGPSASDNICSSSATRLGEQTPGVSYQGQVPLRPISFSGQSYLGQAYLGQPLFRPGLSTI